METVKHGPTPEQRAWITKILGVLSASPGPPAGSDSDGAVEGAIAPIAAKDGDRNREGVIEPSGVGRGSGQVGGGLVPDPAKVTIKIHNSSDMDLLLVPHGSGLEDPKFVSWTRKPPDKIGAKNDG